MIDPADENCLFPTKKVGRSDQGDDGSCGRFHLFRTASHLDRIGG